MCVKINMLCVQCTVYILHIYAHSAIRLLSTVLSKIVSWFCASPFLIFIHLSQRLAIQIAL